MSRKVEAIVGYLKYWLKSQSKYRIHSPFVYDFYKNVLKDDHNYPQYRTINRLRKDLEYVSRFIKRKDMGARAKDFPGDQRFVRVGDIAHRSAVSQKKGELLFRVVKHYNPKSILELGTSLGISTVYMGLSAPESHIVTIEGCLDSANVAHENFEKTGLRNIHIITGSFEDKLAVALEEMPVPDLVFFDGNHKLKPTLDYFELCLQHIHPGTVFIFDDIHWSAGMEEAWKIICRDSRVKVSVDIYQMGFVFFKEELSKEDFTLRF
jgi:predicted O-methyltransferase YrrM